MYHVETEIFDTQHCILTFIILIIILCLNIIFRY